MVDVSIASQEVSVISGPQNLTVQVGLGKAGQRGSRIFVGESAPSLFFVPEVSQALGLELFDLYINANSADSDYLYLYQFISSDGGNVWQAMTRIAPTQINVTEELTFTTGSATLDILLTDYYPLSLIDEAVINPINVTATLEGADPTAISVVSKDVTGETLSIVFKAAKLDGTWALLSGSHTVNANVNFVPAINEIS